jgi:RNA polymerase sigma-70 factor (ECF subfamily)
VLSASLHARTGDPSPPPRAAAPIAGVGEGRPSFEAVYEEHFALVWRTVRRLGVPEAFVEDAVQEVFLVVHRRLDTFEGRSSLKTWVCAIVARVASDARRARRRKSPHTRSADAAVDADTVPDERADDPHDRSVHNEGVRVLHRLLDELDDGKRAVLVLAELEQMSVPEIAEALGENVNTVYARLRAARREFEQAAIRERARDERRLR